MNAMALGLGARDGFVKVCRVRVFVPTGAPLETPERYSIPSPLTADQARELAAQGLLATDRAQASRSR